MAMATAWPSQGQWVPEVTTPICFSPSYTGHSSRAMPRPVIFSPTRRRDTGRAFSRAALPMKSGLSSLTKMPSTAS